MSAHICTNLCTNKDTKQKKVLWRYLLRVIICEENLIVETCYKRLNPYSISKTGEARGYSSNTMVIQLVMFLVTSKGDIGKWHQKVMSRSDVQKWHPKVKSKNEVQKWCPKVTSKIYVQQSRYRYVCYFFGIEAITRTNWDLLSPVCGLFKKKKCKSSAILKSC